MIKNLLLAFFGLFSVVIVAQEGTSSPYSFFGIGDVRFKGTIENQIMAGVGIEQDSIHFNIDNPASFSHLKLTNFGIGMTYGTRKLDNGNEKAKTERASLDYLAVGLPLGKFGAGFGLIPYSAVGYKIQDGVLGDPRVRKYSGQGGLNKVFIALGYKVNTKLSIGADVQYNFGKIETTSLQVIDGVDTASQDNNVVNLSGINFNLGAMYQTKLNKKLTVFSGANLVIGSSLKSKNEQFLATVNYTPELEVSSIELSNINYSQTKLQLPTKISGNLAIGEIRKWYLGGKIMVGTATNLSNYYNNASGASYGRIGSVSLGGYYIPDFMSYNSYFKRITFRAGIRYEKTGLVFNTQSINDTGFTFGVGLPITGSFSNINVGFELGKRGTTNAGLVKENYGNIKIGLSFNDRWFEKRKFN